MNGTKEALYARIILIQFMASGFSLCKFSGVSFPPMDVQYCLRASDVLADASLLPITDCNVLVNGSISLRAKVCNSFDINNLFTSLSSASSPAEIARPRLQREGPGRIVVSCRDISGKSEVRCLNVGSDS